MSSWESIEIHELDLEAEGVLTITFLCPRCGKRQSQKVGGGSLKWGYEINCDNPACGDREMYFELSFNVVGSKKGLKEVTNYANMGRNIQRLKKCCIR